MRSKKLEKASIVRNSKQNGNNIRQGIKKVASQER